MQSEQEIAMDASERSSNVAARELVCARTSEYCTVFTGTMAVLLAAGVATVDQFPTGIDGDKMWTKSGGYKGCKKNPGQRWKVRRLKRGDLFEVYRYHEPRSTQPAFERFMLQAMRPPAQ
jgi:hypothetical protein